MKFRTLNTKNKKEYVYDESEIIDLFECDSSRERLISKEDFEEYINNITDYIGEDEDAEEAIKDFKEYWSSANSRYVLDEKDYLKELIEYEKWTSPKGVASVFEVIEVID